jgi:hypothetical protein
MLKLAEGRYVTRVMPHLKSGEGEAERFRQEDKIVQPAPRWARNGPC